MHLHRHVAMAVLLAAVLSTPAVNASGDAAKSLHGELVIVDATARRFRVVGYDGTYVAPAGTSLDSLGGTDVYVQLGPDGRVTQIQPAKVAITPITQTLETVRGELVVKDAAARTFAISGYDPVYTAPEQGDLQALNGKWVEVRLAPDRSVLSLTPVTKP
ncbi:MAG: hypothetical protein AB7V27_07635 [Candidatus Binatia bacterium]